MNLTPESWRHVVIVESEKGTFSVVGAITYMRFGPLAMMALGQNRETKTERIGKAEALAVGAKLEKALADNNPSTPKKRKS